MRPPPSEGLARASRPGAALTPPSAGRTFATAALAGTLLACCCGSAEVRPTPTQSACVPECLRANSCAELDARLVAARQPLLSCVGEQARRGRLDDAHRCYRSLRLLESARWWLSTIMASNDDMSSVYQPSESIRREFLCRIEQLSMARSPSEVERLYLDTIRSYP